MFGPKDEGLQLPLQGKLYHGRRVICDAAGNELFILEVVRPSIEAREMLDEWMAAICEKFNPPSWTELSNDKFDETLSNQSLRLREEKMKDGSIVQTLYVGEKADLPKQKRGRGRPRKVK